MKSKKIFRIIFITLLVLWMAVIFFFSSRNADDSTRQSLSVGIRVGTIFVPGFQNWTEEEQLAFAEKIDHPVRKCAHASEYCVLGILWVLVLRSFGIRKRSAWWIALLASAAYAGTDEFHQLFVAGRSCQFTDVLVDSGGALLGIGIAILVCVLYNRIYKRKLEKRKNKWQLQKS